MKEKNIKLNSILNMIKTVSSVLFPLITFPYISRVLGPGNIGKVNFGSSFVSYFTLIATLGITTYAIRECSAVRDNKEKLSKVSSEIFSINLCTTVIAYVLLAVSLIFFRELDSYRTLIIIQSTVILFTTLGADWLNSAMEDFAYITIRTISFQILSLLLMFAIVRQPDDYMKYACVTVISTSGAHLLNVFYRRKYCNMCFTISMKWKMHFKAILFLFVMILSQTIFSSADVTMLGLMKDDFEVGIYSSALKIEQVIAQVVSSLAWVVMPRLSNYFANGDYEKINQMLKKVLGVLFLIGLPSIAGVWSLSKEIVLIAGGTEYAKSSVPLCILMLSFGFSLVGGSFLGNMVLLPAKQEKTYMWICCVATFVNVVLNFFLIPIGGAKVAAATTAFSSLIIMSLLLIKKDKRIKINYLWEVMKMPLLGSVLIMVYCYLIGLFINTLWTKTILCMGGSILLYGMVMILSKNEICLSVLSAVKKKMSR